MRTPSLALHGWDWWQSIGSPRTVCAPMVDQSEKAFRMLCRELGTTLAYTPMMHARLFTEVPEYRRLHFDPEPSDTPLIGQLAGHDPEIVLKAARMIEDQVDAVDLNFGCPQGIARKGRYGAFLLDEPDVMVSLVSTLSRGLSVPVTAKLRLLPSRPASLDLLRRLEDAGASVLALHGRTRDQNKQYCGAADWGAIREAVDAVSIPVVANGGIASLADVEACLETTGAAAVMSSEALLENPALFCGNREPQSGAYLDQDELARRYLNMCAMHPPSKGAAMMRGHLFKILHGGLRSHPEVRDKLLLSRSLVEMRAVADELAAIGWEQPRFHTPDARPELSWYARHMPPPGAEAGQVHEPPLTREAAEAAALLKRQRKKNERKRRLKKRGSTRQRRRERDDTAAASVG